MVVLNWKSGLGNVTLSTTSGIWVPFQADLPPSPIPPEDIAQIDAYDIYFQVKSIDATTGDVTFKKDSDGFLIPYGYSAFRPSNGSDQLEAIGYLPGSLPGGVYSNALNLTTIRLGGGNDSFTVVGTGITQQLSATVSKEASQGYIFQSNIYAEGGDDFVRVLMPWQSTFKGGSNTLYHDAIFNPSGAGIAITLSDSLTLQEVSYGDTIELKGSRFDWDLEFKDGNHDGVVTLASILDDSSGDYIATSNNNQISGFERVLFGDILFDLILARQQDSNRVFGQPDYYLNGAENQAPELNSDIASGSELWESFRFNRTKLEGISGTATSPVDVFTGDAGDTPFVIGALRFASLNTEGGNDIVSLGSADQATVDLGSGFNAAGATGAPIGTKIKSIRSNGATGADVGGSGSQVANLNQLTVTGTFDRSTARGGAGRDNIILRAASNSQIFGNGEDDVIQIQSSISQTIIDGGGNSGDILILPGTYASYLLGSSNTSGTTTFNDGFGNIISGFPTIKFSDINLDALEQLSLSGLATPVEEGSIASYAIALASGSNGLQAGQSVAFSLQLANASAQFGSDLAALSLSALQGSTGIVLSNISVDATAGLIKAVASATQSFKPGDTIARLALPVQVDLLTETDESFTLTLRDYVQSQTVSTTIRNVLPVAIKLTSSTSTVEEGQTASFEVALDSVGLAAGRSVTFVIDISGGTAGEGADFSPVLDSDLIAGPGISLSGKSTDPTSKAVTVTATNTSGAALAVGAKLLSFQVPISVDSLVEGNETFGVTLASATALISGGLNTTTIKDLVPAPSIALIGEARVSEGQSAAYAVTLSNGELLAGQSVIIALDTSSKAATKGKDFATLTASSLQGASGITLGALSTDPVSKAVTLTATNTSGSSIVAGSQLLTFAIASTQDSAIEPDEDFTVSLKSIGTAIVSHGLLTTTIEDDDFAPSIQLEGMRHVMEGQTADYAIVLTLEGAGLSTGQSVSITLAANGDTASKDQDFAALSSANLQGAPGVTLSAITTNPLTKTITLTATNSSGSPLAPGSQLLTFSIKTSSDTIVEGDEKFSISLGTTSNQVSIGNGKVETIITDATKAELKLSGPSDSEGIAEGKQATYSVSLDGTILASGQQLTLTLDSQSGTALEGTDVAALVAADLKAAAGIDLSNFSTDPGNKAVTVTATNISQAELSAGSQLLNFVLQTVSDQIVEGNETFTLNLTSSLASTKNQLLTTQIIDDDSAAIKITGPSSVAEGTTNEYSVTLDGVGLGRGESIRFTIGIPDVNATGTATPGSDYRALTAGGLRAAPGVTLSSISTDQLGYITVKASNLGSSDIAPNSPLLQFNIESLSDAFSESSETYDIILTSIDAFVGSETFRTTINDASDTILRLAGSTQVNEGDKASYVVRLDGVGLGVDRSVIFSLDTASGLASNRASEGIDFAALVRSNIKEAAGLSLDVISTDPVTKSVTVKITNNSGLTLPVGSELASIEIETINDSIAERDELFDVTLVSSTDQVSNGLVSTAIKDDDPALIRLAGATSLQEGETAGYAVVLVDNLAAGRSVTMSLTTVAGTATEGRDFGSLMASSLVGAAGITLTALGTDPSGKSVTVTATNTGGTDLAAGAQLLRFAVATKPDNVPEAPETYTVNLNSSAVLASAGAVTTTINDDDGAVIMLDGAASVEEGGAAGYGVWLAGMGLGAGQSVSITLDATDETATSGQDYLELLMSAWLAAPSGLSLGSSSINPISHALTVSVTNTSGSDLQTGAQLLTFAMPTAVDSSAEGNESYAINLTSHSAKVSKGTVITTISDYSGIPGNPAVAAIPPSSQGSGGIANPPSANTNSGPSSFVPSAPQKPKSRLTEAFGSLDFETDDASASKFSKSTLADFSKTVPLSSDASKFLDRYRVQQASGARSAADPSTSVLELNLNLGQFGSSSVGDVALTTEVAATASLYINPITGEAKDNTYDPKTGLGVELIDSNSNGLVDRLKIHMRDGSPQDADGVVDGRILTSTLLADAPRQAVYRFFKQKSGVHFYTSDSVECAFLIQNSYSPGTTLESLRTNPTLNALYPEEYRFEGIAYQALETQGTALYRFYNASKGYHFLSTSTDEANTVIRNSLGAGYDVSNAVNKDPITGGWGYKYEGTSYKVSTIAQHGMDQAVYRFFNVEKGVHFYTISTEERDNVIRNSVGAAYVGQLDQARNAALLQGGWGYRFEGTAWYV